MFSDDGSNPEPDPDYTEYMTGKKNILGTDPMPGERNALRLFHTTIYVRSTC